MIGLELNLNKTSVRPQAMARRLTFLKQRLRELEEQGKRKDIIFYLILFPFYVIRRSLCL